MTICKRTDLSDFFNTVTPLYQNALIIEWLDSVGVYVFINNDFEFGYSIYEDGNTYPTETKIDFSTRQEATTEAIKKANKIINIA